MDKYTIYSTIGQTKKAIELGAPIEMKEPIKRNGYLYLDKIEYIPPTVEQMINWLTEQEILLCINPIDGSNFYWTRGVKVDEKYRWESHFEINKCKTSFNTRQEATLDAIDNALEYLLKK